jgi:hypothetical protein
MKFVYKLSSGLILLYLLKQREHLDKHNLIDSYSKSDYPTAAPCEGLRLKYRTLDGTCNDLKQPAAGSAGYRFGRNVPMADNQAKLLTPNPRAIAQALMKRDKPLEGKGLNLLVTAWIQFQTHDWILHEVTDWKNPIVVPVPEGDELLKQGVNKILVPRTVPDDKKPTAYRNVHTHWWDLSQIYGVTEEANKRVRTFKGGKLKWGNEKEAKQEANAFLAQWLEFGEQDKEVTGFNDNWWTGLAMMHNLFTREHNYVCDLIAKAHPKMSDQELHDTARLAVTLVNAKIHTVFIYLSRSFI